ncbi:hypothetical protein AVEN_123082-1 [Araneus ventricosus]|uniref:Uncharacterized protein n=1 Tax=Araneus ventricosus TaxID=182803 RepID=A0A4Y2RPT7_ARAVE|nr:hypothetical protein AVEN_123082-1 [Araneus ventricosus]
MSAFCDAEENYSCETSPHIDEDMNFNDLEFDCINVDSTDNEDNDTNQNYDVKVNLANSNEPLYPSSSKGHLFLLNDFALYTKEFETLEARLADAPDIDFFVCSVGPLDGCFEG